MSIYVIIPAGGSSSRYSSTQPKLMETIHNKSILMHSLDRFTNISEIKTIIIAYPKDQRQWFVDIEKQYPKASIIPGGETRAESVYNAFITIPNHCTRVMIHDAARPNVSPQLIQAMIENTADAIIPGIKVTDTLKEAHNNSVVKTIDREKMMAIQTPQLFSYALLKECYEKIPNRSSFTDESSLVEAIGKPIQIIPGDSHNIKLTYPIDYQLLSLLMSNT